jgi:DNA replication protein DnaC
MTTHPLTTLSEHDLDASLKRLNLATVRRLYRDVVTRAEHDQWTFRDFLAVLVAEEVAHRTQTRVQAFTRQARFPFLKTIEEFDFSLQSYVVTVQGGLYFLY